MRKQEQIKHIMSDFDFNKIHSVMKFLDWKWSYENGDKKTPNVDDLKSIAEHCLNQVSDSEDEISVCSAGGFEAEKIENTLELRFILDKVNPLEKLLNLNAKNDLARKS
jgi:hypothetical protein